MEPPPPGPATCGRCGATLPSFWPESLTGLCPRCLLEIAVLPMLERGGDESTELSPSTKPLFSATGGSRFGPGEVFGAYRIERLLGSGGMGEVYAAEHIGNGRRVALKLLRQRLSDPRDRSRFIHEGQLAASLNHPHTVYVYGTEEIAGTPAITMELVAAGTLKDRVRESGPLAPVEAVDVILQVIAGLDAAQAAGILHRDIKPSNCFVDANGTVKVGDFGLSISTLARGLSQTTLGGGFQGTPEFASPEQLAGRPLDLRADLYSVGATLYYLLTGQPPFEDPDLMALVTRVATEPPRSPRLLQSRVPHGLAALVLRCLAKDKAARPATYAALADDLRPFSSQSPTPASLGLRAVAGGIDALVLATLSMPMWIFANLWAEPSGELTFGFGVSVAPWNGTIIVGIWFLYFILFEGFGSVSIGKRFCGLRLAGLNDSRAGLTRVAVRTALFMPVWIGFSGIPLSALSYLFVKYGGNPGAEWTLAGADLWRALALLWLPLLFLRARRDNGFSGYHDLVTKTRVVVRSKQAPRPANLLTLDSLPVPSASRSFEPFDIIGTLGSTRDGQIVLATDPILQRRVWIHAVPTGTPSVVPILRDLARPNRLRWLNGRRTTYETWDAYEAPDGAPLLAFTHPQAWFVVKQWLLDLARELDEATSDESMPVLSLNRVWITRANRALLLDFQTPGSAGPLGDELSPHAFLRAVADHAMTGRSSRAGSLPVNAALPLQARKMLDALASGEPASIPALLKRVTTVAAGADSVSRWRRALPIALANVPATLMLLILVLWLPGIVGVMRAEPWAMVMCLLQLSKIEKQTDPASTQQREMLETYVAARFGSRLADDALWRTRAFSHLQILRPLGKQALVRHPSVSDQDLTSATIGLRARLDNSWEERRQLLVLFFVAFPLLALMLTSSLSLMSAVSCRGGALMRALRIAIMTRDGTEASRWKAFRRSVVTWSPVWLVGLCLAGWVLAGRELEDAFDVTWIVVIALLAMATMSAGLIRTLIHPERGWQDQLERTWVVPR